MLRAEKQCAPFLSPAGFALQRKIILVEEIIIFTVMNKI
jgi:hypothetical protein